MLARALVVGSATLLPVTGCLSQSHQISRTELARIAAAPPADRSAHVHVVQDWGGDEPTSAAPVTAETQVVFLPFQINVGGGGRGGGGRPGGGHPHPGGSHGSGGSSSGSSSSSGGSAEAAAALAVVAVAVAASAVVVVGVIEGARYDGYVQLHPMHPVHLTGPSGEQIVVPLSSIDATAAAWATSAVVVPSEGPWLELGRRPLDRIGWTYAVLMGGASSVSADHGLGVGFGSHIQLGYFPTQQIGVVADVQVGWRDNAVGQTLFDLRYGLEVDAFPVAAGPLHAGLFAGIGMASRLEDGLPGGNHTGGALTGGAQLQLELSTRLALTARFGLTRAHDETTREVMVGLSVY